MTLDETSAVCRCKSIFVTETDIPKITIYKERVLLVADFAKLGKC